MRVVQEDKKEVILETVVFLFTDMLLWANAKAITAEKKMKMIGHLILSAAQVSRNQHVCIRNNTSHVVKRLRLKILPRSISLSCTVKMKRYRKR